VRFIIPSPILPHVTTNPPLGIDHVVIAVADLFGAEMALGRALGVRPSWKGRHPTYGTANVLFRLNNAYIELLGIDPEANVDGGTWTAFLRSFLEDDGEGLFALAMQTPDVAATTAGIRARGMAVDDPQDGTGVDLGTGATRAWTNARVPAIETKGTACFFIQHRSPADALPMAPLTVEPAAAASSIVGLSIESSEADAAVKMWSDVIGLEQSAADGATRLSLTNGSLLVYAGVGKPEAPHRWQKLLLRVPSLTALADRLDDARIDFQQGEFREGAGVLLECCGVEILMIESA
jgi:hypothetical protein